MEISRAIRWTAARGPHKDELVHTSGPSVMHESRSGCGRLSIGVGGHEIKVNYVIGMHIGREIRTNIMELRTHNVPDWTIATREDIVAAFAEAAINVARSNGYTLDSRIHWLTDAINGIQASNHHYVEGAD